LYQIGMSGIPIVNVNNNCSTGSSALFLARQAIASGAVDCVLVLGFEQMSPGALGSVFQDRPSPFDAFDAVTDQLVGMPQIPLALRYFGGAGWRICRNTAHRWRRLQKSAPKPAAMR
jgi:acetyl-CoA acetyltransferase